jgi:hypothetical protein
MLLPVQESLRCQGAKKGRSVGYSKKEEFVMKKAFGKLLGITALATIICLTGLAMSGAALAQQCVDNKDGTVTDKVSGLMWQTETAGPMTWYAATSYANSLSLGGKTGWRLPDKDELQRLYSSPCLGMMSVEGDYYWSSTTCAYRTGAAWHVDSGHGATPIWEGFTPTPGGHGSTTSRRA